MKAILFIMLILLIGSGWPNLNADPKPITVEELWQMNRLGEALLSPDGQWLVYELTVYRMAENRSRKTLHLLNLKTLQSTLIGDTLSNRSLPVWSPDSREVVYTGNQAEPGQLFAWNIATAKERFFIKLPVDPEQLCWSGDGQWLAFSAPLFHGAHTLYAGREREKQIEADPVKARIVDRLPYRLWNQWKNDYYTHVFITSVAETRTDKPSDEPTIVDMTPGDYHSPPLDLGGDRDFCFSHDSRRLVFVRNTDRLPAVSTNNDIFMVEIPQIGRSAAEAERLTVNPAVDNQPVFAPHRRLMAYRAMSRPGFEADQYDLCLLDPDSRHIVNLTPEFDQDVDQIVWHPSGHSLFFSSLREGRTGIYQIPLKGGNPKCLVDSHTNQLIGISPDGKKLYYKKHSSTCPKDLYTYDITARREIRLTRLNDSLMKELVLNPVEDFYFTGDDGRTIHGLVVKPPFFDPNRHYPVVCLIHGGPQGAWSDEFHYRWNPQLFSARGYGTVMINIRGSKGYGQDFCDQVSRNWGGTPFRDLMIGLDSVLAQFPWLDSSRMAAAGASYGGYMVNWIAVHPESRRFDALITHAGVYNILSEYGATEELWFPEWEFGGTPYAKPDEYLKWSPSTLAHQLAVYKTPTLVIHGELDYRVPINQGLEMFTALQRHEVPSRLLYFPDECHFVQKPQNARLWWNTMLNWIDHWCR
ncbi:MAG: S9 family peptidase [Candidatus Delongbacteria bacterium]|nr:S9 family peptidase [Candidatus Delongbacteria bacterium]